MQRMYVSQNEDKERTSVEYVYDQLVYQGVGPLNVCQHPHEGVTTSRLQSNETTVEDVGHRRMCVCDCIDTVGEHTGSI